MVAEDALWGSIPDSKIVPTELTRCVLRLLTATIEGLLIAVLTKWLGTVHIVACAIEAMGYNPIKK